MKPSFWLPLALLFGLQIIEISGSERVGVGLGFGQSSKPYSDALNQRSFRSQDLEHQSGLAQCCSKRLFGCKYCCCRCCFLCCFCYGCCCCCQSGKIAVAKRWKSSFVKTFCSCFKIDRMESC